MPRGQRRSGASSTWAREDDVRNYIVRRDVKRTKEDAMPYTKARVQGSKIQRRRRLCSLKDRCIKHQKEQKAEFKAFLAEKKAKLAGIKAAHRTVD
ncbi:hypothetical protein H0H87_009632 [Tephrocybe sp. NHM501043]|nr:hypothetical protein H0H87_009632 [Tephrocybe sp. NHM501043]